MRLVIGGVVFLFLLGAVGNSLNSPQWREWRAYMGLFLIALLVAVMGWVVDLVLPGASDTFLLVAKWIAVVSAGLICLRMIVGVCKTFFIK
ncbi:hypothetical protein [Paraburkholderia dipogonis]|uniref:hypothetical protein n=1 Tax=Paraburkholderia dipogonis TaxID=1211383 RepID=UPI0038BE1525